MVDNKLRTYRTHDPVADADAAMRAAVTDPLAELARLIGQTDPVGEFGRSARRNPAESRDAAPPADAGLDLAADDGYAGPDDHADNRVEPRLVDSYPSGRAYQPQNRDYGHEPSGASPYAEHAAGFHDARDNAMAHDDNYRDEPAGSGRDLPLSGPHFQAAGYEIDDQLHDGEGESYATDEDTGEEYDDAPNGVRRSGVIVVLAVLALATLGIAGAFAYRTMFGGTMLPSLPPIIKAGNGPNKIIPSHSESQADASSQAGATNGTNEKLVSHEEQPLNIQTPPSTAPRVISTIPILPAPGAASQGAPPPVARPTAAAPAVAPTPAPAAAPGPPVPPVSAAAASEPKKIHTVIIRPDQLGGASMAAVPLPPSAPQGAPAPTTRPVAPHATVAAAPRPITPSASHSAANAPLAIVPAQERARPPAASRTQVARTETSAPLATSAASARTQGGYSVQLTSQRSEADALAEFRALRAKFPNQLRDREPIIRRADLGEKGTYYRALVGPFASVEEATGLCSNLKAAGGACVVQRN